MNSLQIHFLTSHPASCLVRGIDNRPKMLNYGGVDRARVSSASLKRAVRVSPAFRLAMEGHLGHRTKRVGTLVASALVQRGIEAKRAEQMANKVASAFGKFSKGTETEQLCFTSAEEISAAIELAEKLVSASDTKEATKLEASIADLVHLTTRAVDVALFGRMFAAAAEKRMTAAAEVAHPFTVDRASLETDFFVAIDDERRDSEANASFISEQYFTSGLFYGYARIDMDQLTANLGGDLGLAERAAKAFIRGLLTVSPSGKVASYGTHALASWAMIERGSSSPRSLASAFLKPVKGDDHLAIAAERAEMLAKGLDVAYGDKWVRAIMNVPGGNGSLAELLDVVVFGAGVD
jgi:CRISPR system Cascade subunit CasC